MPEIRSSELAVQIAGLSLDKAQSGYKPTITAGGSVGASYAGSKGYLDQLHNTFNQQIGLTFSVPLFTRRLSKTNAEKARIAIDQAKLDLKETKTALSLNIERAYINLTNASSQYDAAAESLKYNQETYRIANEELRLGAANMFTFYQQRNLYRQAMQNFIQAKYNAALTLEIYNFYNGDPVLIN